MTAHTAGPWYAPHFVDDSTPCNCQCVISPNCYPGAICTVEIDNGKSIGRGGNGAPPLEEAKANALLIAAAPDLLAALKDLVNECGDDITDEPTLTAARAAIDKAEGR